MKSGFVSFIGRPNAGKSTLLNRLVGEKLAIVSDKPQTTRNRILGVRNYPDAQVIFLDTPGIHRPLHRMNVRMVDAARDTLSEVDIVALVVDVSEKSGRGDQFVLDMVKDVDKPVFLVLNKIDLIKKVRLLPVMEEFSKAGTFAEIVPVSAGTGLNIDSLEKADHRQASRRTGALPGGLPDRSAGALHGVRNHPREGPAVHACGASVFERGRRGPVRGTGRRKGICGCTAASSSSGNRRSRSSSAAAAR